MLFIALEVASLSMPAMDSMPLMSLPSVFRFSPFGKPQSLPDLVKPPAFSTLPAIPRESALPS